jgi:hypothetical protein
MYKYSIPLTPGPAPRPRGNSRTLSSPEARLVYRLPEPDMHGRQELRLTPLERLARLVPPDQRFASVPAIAIATTESWLPTHA